MVQYIDVEFCNLDNDEFTAMVNSIGNSGGTTEVMTMIQSKINLD